MVILFLNNKQLIVILLLQKVAELSKLETLE